MLVPAFFMLNVYDKAIGSNSTSTLVVLSVIAFLMFIGLFAMQVLRSKVLIIIGNKIDRIIAPLLYEATLDNALKVGANNATIQPISDFSSLRQFVFWQWCYYSVRCSMVACLYCRDVSIPPDPRLVGSDLSCVNDLIGSCKSKR